MTNRKEFLGELEELVLLMVAILQDNAYGKNIMDEIREQLHREVSLSALHITLYRLEDKGLLKSSLGGITNERGGRRKRFYSLTNNGITTIRALKRIRLKLWNQVTP